MSFATALVCAALFASPLAARATPDLPCHECPQTVWYVDASRPANGTGDSWVTAFNRLQSALNQAAPGDCIWVAAGIYKPTFSTDRTKTFTIEKSLRIYGGFDGTELCLADRAGKYWETVLSGDIGVPGVDTDNSHTIVTMTGPVPVGQTLDVLLDGFRIVGAYNDDLGHGGGIFAFTGSLRLQNCFLRNNEARFGGGMYAQGCTVSMIATRFGLNSADDGGGYYGNGGDIVAINSTLRRNVARKRGGGAYLVATGLNAEALWANVLFEGNQADRGGAMFLKDGTSFPPPKPWIQAGRARLVGCTVSRNLATTEGPALLAVDDPILVSLAGELLVENTVVWNNTGPPPQIVGMFRTDVFYSIVPLGSPWAGGFNLAQDPLLVPPSWRPMSGSPAIDMGSSIALPFDTLDLDGDGDVSELLPWDRLNRKRVQGGGVDIGAAEY